MRDSFPAALGKIRRRLPFGPVLAVVLLLYLAKERYPFSNFPMYSNVDREADIVYVTDQADQALPMDAVFQTGSGTAKKMYKSGLASLTKAAGRKIDAALTGERAAAGREVMETLVKRIRAKKMPATVTSLRLYRKTFRLEEAGLTHEAPELLAELPVSPP